ncbi:MAG: glycosyltransferase [Chthoniobacteraceae bacterium]
MRVYLETGNTARVGARSGIPTVVRGLLAGLDSRKCDAHPVRWSFNEAALTPLKPKWESNLDRPGVKKPLLPLSSLGQPRSWPLWMRTMGMDYKAPIHLHPSHDSKLEGSWLILPELLQGQHIRLIADYAKKHGMRVAGIFYDAIPWLHPELVLHRTASDHGDYMSALAGLDAVIAISNQSARDFTDFTRLKNLPPPTVYACNLAAQIADQPRETKLKETSGDVVKTLYVSTLEPRKNHLLLLAAFEDPRLQSAEANIELHLVGGSYKEAPEIAEAVRAAAKKNPRIFWHENVGPMELRHFYRDSDFTIFASYIEGFGLPVTESLWFGRPCLCSNEGVVAENAKDGGCLTVNMRDQKAIADGIVKLARQPEFRRELGEQVLQRKLKTWNEYAGDVLQVLKGI